MRRVAAALAVVLLAACTGSGSQAPKVDGSPPPSSPPAATVRLVGPSAAAAMRHLCHLPPLHEKPVTKVGRVPAIVTETEHEDESVRGLQYLHPVAVRAVTHAQLAAGIEKQFAHSFPTALVGRESLALQTIGALPKTTSLGAAIRKFQTTQVIGYYDSDSKELRFIGTNNPTPSQRYVLSHELIHALDDQHFNISRLDTLGNACQDEPLEAATGVIEGSAVFFSTEVVFRFFTQREQNEALHQSGEQPTGVPRFVTQLEDWPYIAGPRFIAALLKQGGTPAVNRALRHLPVSTEQVIHPSRYPNDTPTTLDIGQLAPRLGKGWHDLDVEEVGEEWLAALLSLRLDPTEWRPATDGWDGGLYRAWTDGHGHVAVLLRTAWDSTNDAGEFATAMHDWIGGQPVASVVRHVGRSRVDVLFASDAGTLRTLRRAD